MTCRHILFYIRPVRRKQGVSITYKIKLVQKPGFLHAIVTGLNSKENVEQYLEDLIRECAARGCSRLLIEERLNVPRLGPLSVFDIASRGGASILGTLNAIAYVDVNAEDFLMSQFAENVAVNRGAPVTFFQTVAEAEKWLSASSG